MIVKNRNSIVLGKSQRNNQGRNIVTNPKRKINSTPTPPPPTPEDSNTACLNLAPGLYKKKYEGYFDDVNEFFDTKLVSAISIGDIGKSYQILDIGTTTQQDWYNWGFVESPQYSTPEALGLPFPSIGKGVSYFGGGPIENAGTANLGPVLVSESVSSQIDDSYSQAQGQNNKSLIIKGYFKPTVNGVYKFRLYSDDASYLWVGNNALDGNRTISNSVVSLPGIHGPYHTDPPGTFTMVANSYYPLTVEFGNGPAGEGVLIFDYMPPGSNTWTSDLAGKLFYDVDSKGHRVCAPPSAYFGRVLSLDAVSYNENPNQISFDGAGVSTVDGVYVYTQTGAPISGSMFHNTGFYGPVVSGKNNFVEFDVQYGKTGYFVGDWIENDWTYFNTGNIPFVNRVEIQGAIDDIYTRTNSGDNTFNSLSQNGRRITKNQNSGWDLQDDDNITRYTNDDVNLDPNGWYYDFVSSIIISNAGTATSNGTYTRSAGGDTTFTGPNGNYISKDGAIEFSLWDSQVYNPDNEENGGITYLTENFSSWYVVGNCLGESPDPVGLTSTTRVYPRNKTDGLLGIQYSGYFDSDPTWFNTASVKPIINELFLNHPTSDMVGPYIKVGDQNNQGTSYFQGTQGNDGWAIYYHSAFSTSESYWYLQANIGPIHSKSNDLITWTMTPEAIEEYGDEGAPTTTITQTQNFENSTNFGTTRALSNDTSWQWVGYFRANDTSNHNFYINADEDAYFWIGNKALNGYTTGNADMYSIAYNSTNIINLPLTSGTYYPVRLQWGHPANPTTAGLSLSYRNGAQGDTYDFSGLFFNSTGDGIATNSNDYVYDFTLGEWQSTNTGYNPAPNAVYSHVWLDSISGFNNSGVIYTGNKHVTLVNNPTYSSDYSGIYSFNGVDQYAMTQEVPQSTDGSISYFIWFKPTGAGVVVDELGQPGLFGGWHDSQLEVTQDGKVNFGIWGDYRTNSTFKIQSTGSINFDRWYHLGLTYFSGVLSAYINGEKIADSNCQRMNGPTNLYYAICGGDSTNMGEGGFGKGSVGSFQVYNTGLTEIQVANLYSGEKDRFPNIDNMFFPSLWLDASTGINKFSYNYISQIVLSGNPSVTGTYNASSIPTYNFEDNRLNDYSLGNISYSINGDGDYDYRIITENVGGTDIGYQSFDGINWSTYNSYISQFIINGFTGIYTDANGTYNRDIYNLSDFIFSKGQYRIEGNTLSRISNDGYWSLPIATTNNYVSWDPASYPLSITISGPETAGNGTYTRLESLEPAGFGISFQYPTIDKYIGQEEQNSPWYVKETRKKLITVNGEQIWNNEYEFFTYYTLNGSNISPNPSDSVSVSPFLRSIGSPTSTAVSIPSGSIIGNATTETVNTNHVNSWEDQSENARNASLSSYIPSSYVTIGGKSFVNFPANTNLTCPTIWYESQFIGTIFCVARFTENIVNSFLVYHESEFKFLRDTSNTLNLTFDGNSVLTSSNTLNANTNYILETTFNADTARLYYNGIPVGTASLGSANGGYNLFIGGGDGSSNIAEVIIYNRVLDTSERQEVESYLSNKYSITPTPPGIPYASTASITSDYLGFTLTKENDNGDGNLLYSFDESQTTPPRPANYYGYSVWDYDTGTGSRAILFFNTSATTYVSNQPNAAPNVTLSPNTWYLIKFSAGNYDEGSIPPIPDEFSVNTSSSQSADYIPTTGWSPSITITAA